MGGQSLGAGDSGGSDETARTTSATGNTNPGNFANRPKEEVQEIRARAEKPRAAPLSLAVKRRVRLEAGEDRLADIGINGPCSCWSDRLEQTGIGSAIH